MIHRHVAAQEGFLKIVQLLAVYGGHLATPMHEEEGLNVTPIELAVRFDHSECAGWIVAAEKGGWFGLRIAATTSMPMRS